MIKSYIYKIEICYAIRVHRMQFKLIKDVLKTAKSTNIKIIKFMRILVDGFIRFILDKKLPIHGWKWNEKDFKYLLHKKKIDNYLKTHI